MPRVNQVQSDDGSAVLTYEGLDTSHDLGGGNYLLRIGKPGEEAEIRARIRTVTSFEANKLATKEGIDLLELSSRESFACQERFADKYGHRFEFILFEMINGKDANLDDLARILCLMYLELSASYKYNHPDYPASDEGCYPDQVYFCPIDVDRRHYVTIRAGDEVK